MVGNNASGNIPNFAAGMMSAISREMSAAPGTRPVIANDSELILNQAQIPAFIKGVAGMGQKIVTIDMGGITINLPTGSVEDHAISVINLLNSKLAAEMNAILA
jgi:hypothetical protein